MIDYTSYAEIVLKKGINLRQGQNLLITCNAGNYDLARVLGERAYALGAGYVDIAVQDNFLTRARLAAQKGEALSYVPHYQITKGHQMLSEDWARIRIDSTEELDVLSDADPSRLGTLTKVGRQALKFVSKSLMNDEHSWCVITAPGPLWAKKVLGDQADTEDLWKVLKPILRLDKEDPVAEWDRHTRTLIDRGETLNKMKLDRLRFVSSGTDLTIRLNRISLWKGGPAPLPDGSPFLPNIPTEEVFTTPDYSRTEGMVRVTKPLKVLETMVEGAWFRFLDGKVVEFRADKGHDVLEKFLNMDEGARYLGEVALVDESSPIAASGLLFGSILYDENASCHIALGGGYPTCLDLPAGVKSDEELKKLGCNGSLVHTDFMIGSPELDVTGYDWDGKEYPVIRKGSFVI